MKIGNIDYNFDRVVRLTLFNACGPVNDKTGVQKIENVIVIEYDPLSYVYENPKNPTEGRKKTKEGSVARIDFEVINIGPENRNQKPGFTANIKLYNTTDEISQAVAQNGNFGDYEGIANPSTRQKKYSEFMNSRLQCKLEVGYSNGQGGSTLHTLFQGYVNSTFSSRNGAEWITELRCFNRDDTSQQYPETCIVPGFEDYNERKVVERSKEMYKIDTWEEMFKLQVISKELTRPGIGSYGQEKNSRQVSNYSVVINALERIPSNFDEWFEIRYISKPGNPVPNQKLEEKLKNFKIKGFSTSKRDLDSSLNDLCAFKGLNLGWARYSSPDGGELKRIFLVWQAGDSKEIAEGNKADIVIPNYYSLVQPPTVNGGGNMTIKMMLYPTAKPFQSVSLMTVDTGEVAADFDKSYAAFNAKKLTETQQSIAGNLSGNFTPMIQGPYGIVVYESDRKSKGYMFNKAFPIIKVVHTGSTHKKDWYTTLTTIPMAMGYSNTRKVVPRK